MKTYTMNKAKKNLPIRLVEFPMNSQVSTRLVSLGILKGDELSLIGTSFSGSPLAFMKKGGISFALRKDEASQILVEEIE
jgi:Fe2+ transport system protein FeoA